MRELNKNVTQFKESVFATLSRLANENQAINLAQGFPDFDGPQWVIDLLGKSARGSANQYAPLEGDISLRKVILEHFKDKRGLEYDTQKEITITHGATEAIFCSILALVNPGDEVIIFEPFYDSYLAAIQLAGGVPVPITLKGPGFTFDIDELEKSFSQKTKLILFNHPHNPTGRVFNDSEITQITSLTCKYDSYLLCDEVYEYLVYDHQTFKSLAQYPGMRDRTITISSIGKTFGLTGWKVGWAIASEDLSFAIRKVHQFTTFCAHHPTQKAAAQAYENLDDYLPTFIRTYQEKRDLFVQGLKSCGLNPVTPEGTYFVMCPIPDHYNLVAQAFSMELIKKAKVATIPPESFYINQHFGERYLRFCFAKKEETLKKSISRLKDYFNH